MADKTHSEPGTPGVLSRLAGIAVVAVVLAGIYVGYQALQVLFPPNTYETAMLATVADTVSADGVLLFDETYISGSGTLGYLAADGERVSAGAAVAEIYSSPEQAGLRQQLTALNDQIELLQRSQNTTATQLDSLRKERSGALYDLMDALDSSAYDETAQGENYIPGVYVKYGNLARFCKIDPMDSAHPLVTDGDYCIVMPSSTDKTKTISEVRLYDEIIVSGQNLYDGKLL